jgi:hypothetical protein
MSRVVIAEYDASANTLRLAEPLPDVEDREKVRVSIEKGQGSTPRGNVRDALARLGSLNAPTGDIEQMLAEIEAGRR